MLFVKISKKSLAKILLYLQKTKYFLKKTYFYFPPTNFLISFNLF